MDSFLFYIFLLKEDNLIWECNFEKDDCGFDRDSPNDLNFYKFERGYDNIKDNGENDSLYNYLLIFYNFKLILAVKTILIDNYFYAKFKNFIEDEAKIYSPTFNIKNNVKRICLDFKFWIGDISDKIEVYTFHKGILQQQDYCLSSPLKTGRWQTKIFMYSSRFDRVNIFIIVFFISLSLRL